MRADCLLDTNILVYAVDNSPANRAKQQVSIELIETADFGLSAQVLQEFYVTVTRKLASPLPPESALSFLECFRQFPLVMSDYNLLIEGIRNSVKFQLSYWDGAIIAAAENLHATTLYSEDLNHGQLYGKVRVLNPFLQKQIL